MRLCLGRVTERTFSVINGGAIVVIIVVAVVDCVVMKVSTSVATVVAMSSADVRNQVVTVVTALVASIIVCVIDGSVAVSASVSTMVHRKMMHGGLLRKVMLLQRLLPSLKELKFEFLSLLLYDRNELRIGYWEI